MVNSIQAAFLAIITYHKGYIFKMVISAATNTKGQN